MNGHLRAPSYHRLGAGSEGIGGGVGGTGFKALLSNQGKQVAAFVITIFIAVYYITLPLPPTVSHIESPFNNGTSAPKPANLHVLIPASRADPNLCKVLLSSAAAGYPTPFLINWEQEFDDKDLVEGGSHLAKIRGVNEYLLGLEESHDEDLILMIDGYDIWMQLRPQTVLDRFYAINARADERIVSELGQKVVDKHHIKQEIVFGCQKRCWPWSPSDPPCYAVPESTLVSDIYGSETDIEIPDTEYPYQRNRQRYLNSGVALGTARAMRKLFGQALANAEYESNFGSDQYIFSHIYGDQEVYREMLRRDEMTISQQLAASRLGHGSRERFNETHIEEVRAKAAARGDNSYDFAIGVDFGSEIGLNTVFAEDDTAWLMFNDTASLMAVQDARGIPREKHRTRALQPDIAASLLPYWTFSNEAGLPRWLGWDEVNLLTDVYTGITPAIIHHNAHRDNLKSLRESWWTLLWSQPYLRILYDAYIYSPILPVAISGGDNSNEGANSSSTATGGKREFWPPEIWKGGARAGPGGVGTPDNWIRFDDMCRDFHEELFRDGKGYWELPENH